MTETLESFALMLRGALGDRLDPDAVSFHEMFDPDGVMEFPFAYADLPRRIEGRAALAGHISMLATLITFDRMSEPTIIQTNDPDTVVLEFEGFGTGIATGEPYEQRYVSIIRTRNGRIVHYKDYWNPLAVLGALRGAGEVAKLTGGEVPHG
jgi:ketosteroid isomerase-like protein